MTDRQPDDRHSAFPELPAARAESRRAVVMSVAGLVAAALMAALAALPAPYVIGHPGPTFDTLGEFRGLPLVEISGAPVHESTGELRLTTVAVSRASTRPFTLGRVIQGWLSPVEYVIPEERVFGPDHDPEEHQQESHAQWITSQESATVAALEALGMEVPATLRVAGVNEASAAQGLLEEDDVLVALEGRPMVSYSDLVAGIGQVSAGDDVTVTVLRGGVEVTETFPTFAASDGSALMGLLIDPRFDPPVQVSVALDTVGGPSAGLMFSLAIMEKLTEGDTLAGASVAGTGGITVEGEVRPMGGLPQKMHAARAAGAEFFLLPEGNCAQALRHIPTGLVVIPVDTLETAFAVLGMIGSGDHARLPHCGQTVAGWSVE